MSELQLTPSEFPLTPPTEARGNRLPPQASPRDLVIDSAIRVAPDLCETVPPEDWIVDAYTEGDIFVVEIEFDSPARDDLLPLIHVVADEVATVITPTELSVSCRVHIRHTDGDS